MLSTKHVDTSVTLEGHVLLVDDKAINRKVMAMTLDTAAGGKESVLKVQSGMHKRSIRDHSILRFLHTNSNYSIYRMIANVLSL